MRRQTEEKLDRKRQRLDQPRTARVRTGGPKQTEVEEAVTATSLVSFLIRLTRLRDHMNGVDTDIRVNSYLTECRLYCRKIPNLTDKRHE